MAKVKDKYRDIQAQKHQEVVTPPELVDHIYSFLSDDDFKGDVLEPCVGPLALIEPILKDPQFKSLTVMDIQKRHIDDFKKRYV